MVGLHGMGLRWAVLEAVETCHSSSTVDAAGSAAFQMAWVDSKCLAEVAAVAAGQPGQARRLTCRLVAESEDPCLPKFIVAPGGIGCPRLRLRLTAHRRIHTHTIRDCTLVRYVDVGRCIPGCTLFCGIPFGRRFMGGCCWGS